MLTCSGLLCGDRRMVGLEVRFEFWNTAFGGKQMMSERNLSTGASDASQDIPLLSQTLLIGIKLVL